LSAEPGEELLESEKIRGALRNREAIDGLQLCITLEIADDDQEFVRLLPSEIGQPRMQG